MADLKTTTVYGDMYVNNRVGIGTNLPLYGLVLQGSGSQATPVTLQVAGIDGTNAADARIWISQNGAVTDLILMTAGCDVRTDGLTANDQYVISGQRLNLFNKGNSSTYNTQITLGAGSAYGDIAFYTTGANGTAAERMRISGSGLVGIGTTTPASKLQVYGDFLSIQGNTTDAANAFGSPSSVALGLIDSGVMGQYKGGTLGFGGASGGGTTPYLWSVIKGGKENATAGNYAGYLSMWTIASDSSTAERMRITSTGNVGVGTNSPTASFQVGAHYTSFGGTINMPTAIIAKAVGAAGTIVDALRIDCYCDTSYNKGVAIAMGYGSPAAGEYTSRIVHYGNIASTRGSRLQLQTHTDTAELWSTGLTINELGYVGVGTVSAGILFDVWATASMTYPVRFYQPSALTTAANIALFQGAMTTCGGYYGIAGSTAAQTAFRDSFAIGTYTAHTVNLVTNDSAKLSIVSAGNVGIGVTNPSSFLLQIAGNTGPNSDGTYDLGASSVKWRNVYANSFVGNITSASYAATSSVSSYLIAWENIPANSLVNVFNNTGSSAVRLADYRNVNKDANGYATNAITSGSFGFVYQNGLLTGLTGLTPGDQYLSSSGTITGSYPTASGLNLQYIGVAVNSSTLEFHPMPIVTLVGTSSVSSVLTLATSASYAFTASYTTMTPYYIRADASEFIPRTTNGCGVDSQETSTNKINRDFLVFDPATVEYAQYWFQWPNGWNTAKVSFMWSATGSSGDVVWSGSMKCFSDGDSLDSALGTGLGVIDTLSSANTFRQTTQTSGITPAGTIGAGSRTILEISRGAVNVADTLAIDALLEAVLIERAS